MKKRIAGTLALAAVLLSGVLLMGCNGFAPGPEATPAEGGPTTPVPGAFPSPGSEVYEKAVVDANNRFAFDLYHNLANDPRNAGENIFFSPISVSSALAVTYEGARGTTAEEMRAVFHFPENDTMRREGFLAVGTGLSTVGRNYTLDAANALWAEKTYPFLQEYVDIARIYYSADVNNLDFIDQPEASREIINLWVNERTAGKIADLLPSGSVDPRTRLVITNAVYFKGAWILQFDPAKTTEHEFRTVGNGTVTVPMMSRTDEDAVYGYTETDTLQVIRLPYTAGYGRMLSMLVILPREDNLSAAGEVLDPDGIARLRESLTGRQVRVYFPKFTLDTGYRLPGTLAAMGMPTVFTMNADLSGMDGTKNLYVSDVVHKAHVDVNEEGTEAAAATGVVVNLKAVSPTEQVPVFLADHPFVFLIQDDETGNILFIGRVANPVA
ncbi:serpin B [Methanolinea mesophila]|uniref:serpin family protein n=1 Tax=Methanolinea mesophila TaxID=547055 RepID=UPI001AE81275|nr:serpin family protein [Methanolinea mesophila]MBP1929504.1 serpin B [Methanolinea mesophila]